EWTRLASESGLGISDLRPWWVWHDAPEGTSADRDSKLVEIRPGHWVRLWATPGVGDAGDRLPESPPVLTSRRPDPEPVPSGEGDALPAAR
ncbi:MAG: hypothetical protein AAFN41_05630, partial [Planctomycetota bacterium]